MTGAVEDERDLISNGRLDRSWGETEATLSHCDVVDAAQKTLAK